jgi:hypothetical protein
MQKNVRKKKSTKNDYMKMLKSQVIRLLDQLVNCLPDEQTDLIAIRLYFDAWISPQELMDSFIEYVLPHKVRISERDDTYFKNNEKVFGVIDLDPNVRHTKIYHFSRLWDKGIIDEESKGVVWEYFDVFVRLVELYQKS